MSKSMTLTYEGHGQVTAFAAPERIYGWRDSQLSIARHYGRLMLYGHLYVIDIQDPDQPLVRRDVIVAQRRAAARAAKAERRQKVVAPGVRDLFAG